MNASHNRRHDDASSMLDERLRGDLDALNEFAHELTGRTHSSAGAALVGERVDANPESVAEGLAKLVLALIDLLRQLLEKQALRRMEAGSLTDDQIERMGETFLKLEQKMTELKAVFGLEDEDLTLNLGPARDLRDLLAD